VKICYLCVLPGSIGTLFRWGGKINQLLIAKSLNNICTKNHANEIMFATVAANNVGDPFLRLIVYTQNFQKTENIIFKKLFSLSNVVKAKALKWQKLKWLLKLIIITKHVPGARYTFKSGD